MIRRVWNNSSRSALLEAQENLLQHFVRAPLTSSENVLNYIDSSIHPRKPEHAKTVVMAHGFGSGLGFFFPNYDAVIEHPKVKRVLGVDWLGMGGSHRPSCRAAPRVSAMQLCNSKFTDTQAVDFFIDSLEDWRVAIGLDEPFVLIGHSLGGYLSSRYAMKYPDRVAALLLVSPVGFPESQAGEERSVHFATDVEASFVLNLVTYSPTGTERMQRSRLDLIDALWSANFTPQDILRLLGKCLRGIARLHWVVEHKCTCMNEGPRGRTTVRSILRRRFDNRWDTLENDLIADYLFHISVAKASGEFALNSILKPVLRGKPSMFSLWSLTILFS